MTMNDAMGSRPPGALVVTGATGFLGTVLLPELLKREARPLICLVRADDDAHARRRGQDVIDDPRVTWLRADIEEPALGLDPEAWQRLADRTSGVMHCAASTRFDHPLHEAQQINVDGTLRLLDLATAAPDFDRFHHVSTAYASGRVAGLVGPDHLPDDRASNFRNTYERTKARAERALMTQDKVAVSIYRPSIVAGDTRTGVTSNWNVLYGPMRMIAAGQLPMMPSDGDARVDTVGVDYVAAGIAHLAALPRSGNSRHHLVAGTETFSVPEFVDACVGGADARGKSSRCKLVSHKQWRGMDLGLRVASRAPSARTKLKGRVGRRQIEAFAPYLPYTGVSTVFDNSIDSNTLAEAGITMPPSADYLETIINYALDSRFGRKSLVATGSAL